MSGWPCRLHKRVLVLCRVALRLRVSRPVDVRGLAVLHILIGCLVQQVVFAWIIYNRLFVVQINN